MLMARKSTEKAGWYDLEKDIFRDLINSPYSYYAIVFGDPSKTFVIPANVVKGIFSKKHASVSTGEDNKGLHGRSLSSKARKDIHLVFMIVKTVILLSTAT